MHQKLSPDLIAAIRASTESVAATATRLGVSAASVSKYRPSRRGHLSDSEFDQIVAEFCSGIPTLDTASRFQIDRETVYRVRHKAHAMAQGLG